MWPPWLLPELGSRTYSSFRRFETGLLSSLQQIHQKSPQTSEETAPNRPQAGPNLSLGGPGLSLPDHSEGKEQNGLGIWGFALIPDVGSH